MSCHALDLYPGRRLHVAPRLKQLPAQSPGQKYAQCNIYPYVQVLKMQVLKPIPLVAVHALMRVL